MVTIKHNLPCILAAIVLVRASSFVRGIAPQKLDLYQPSKDKTWTCLDGSKVIPYSAVNDDYCDCADGSDEPGTSACPSAYFYCANEGHIPAYIKSYAVNDGVCDEACCDGSDENGDLISCPNRCKQVGEAYRKKQSSLKKSTKDGLQAKKQLIDEAQKQVALWEEDQIKIEDEIILKKSELLKLERELKSLESRSRTKKETKVPKCQSGALEVATLKHDIVILKKEIDVLKGILGDMKRDHNHNFHDMAVKSAISGYDEFVARFTRVEARIDDNLVNINIEETGDLEAEEPDQDEGEGEDEDEDDKDQDQDQGDDENATKESPLVEGKHSVVDMVLDKLDPILPSVLKNGLLGKFHSHKVVTDVKEDAPSNQQALENTRKLVAEAKDQLNDLSNNLERIKKDLSTDYGADKEWLKLKDVCVEKDEGEYTYSFCFFGDAYQKSNKDSSRTHLGKFAKFDGGDELYKVHVHDRGTRCWNGPERSVRASFECGVKNEIIDVSEPEKCEYHYRLLSPAVCKSVADAEKDTIENSANNRKPVHEEL
ncbi:hypothetical protein [Parasitella parasitica]|uniref:Glucosidase 2 subunit beta n=1 Tax=Parasitella parasitica TaxID=35722 RepID=A0A0B7NUU0_9FUNG|nr:hypothetical protein [Parasitella parasitica]